MKIRKLCIFLGLGVLLMGCNGNENTIDLKITSEDKVTPTDTNLDYVDYGDNSNLNFKYDTTKWYRNDLKLHLPDPCIYEEDGIYYIYGTTDRTGAQTIDCYTTTDFTNYKIYQDVFKPKSNEWGQSSLFAPEIYKINGKYYMYFCAKNGKDGVNTGLMVATCDTPNGKFELYVGNDADGNLVDSTKGATIRDKFRPNIGILDQTLLIDGDDIYMYYSIYDSGIMQYIVGVKMKDPVTPDWETYKILLRPGSLTADDEFSKTLTWECYQNFKVAEGPQVTKTPEGKYMMSYSVNHYPDVYYSVCYAMSDTPLGTYVKPYDKNTDWSNLLFGYAGTKVGTVYEQWQGFMGGTGHHFIFKSGDQYMIAYHAFANRMNIDGGRAVAIDYLYFDENGNPYVHGPSYSIQPLPEAISGYKNISLDATIAGENVKNVGRLNDNFIVEHYQLKQEQNKEASFGAGKSFIKLKFDKSYEVGGIAIYNSAQYEKIIQNISFIKLGNDNNIIDGKFLKSYINHQTEFVFPDSAFNFTFDNVETEEIVIGFESDEEFQLNEIVILGQ